MIRFPKKGKKDSLGKLDEKLWRLFSAYIRQRDSDSNGYIRCITCGKVVHWKESDAGHFVTRDHKAVKFNEKNVNAQCQCCNRFHSGEQYLHGISIDAKYGAGTSQMLVALGSQTCKLDRVWYEQQIEIYKAKVKEVQK